MKNPAKTLRIAGPLAIITVTLFYFLCNFAYFSAASKEEITGSGRLVAALLFRNVWGPSAERILSGFVALSALGNVLSVVSILYHRKCIMADGLFAVVLPRKSKSGVGIGGRLASKQNYRLQLAFRRSTCWTFNPYVCYLSLNEPYLTENI